MADGSGFEDGRKVQGAKYTKCIKLPVWMIPRTPRTPQRVAWHNIWKIKLFYDFCAGDGRAGREQAHVASPLEDVCAPEGKHKKYKKNISRLY